MPKRDVSLDQASDYQLSIFKSIRIHLPIQIHVFPEDCTYIQIQSYSYNDNDNSSETITTEPPTEETSTQTKSPYYTITTTTIPFHSASTIHLPDEVKKGKTPNQQCQCQLMHCIA
ncbi:hypothetical protein EYC84_004397 [Monilinia fructicola]|uniref:Uncharacterized protein n=1 Tax=Monilinia fructicola TaxID=38448 RepID=A0A5M9K2R2_MONFR|nr:hypothetical protein EYC84_004397 [Monilinia fructicola]